MKKIFIACPISKYLKGNSFINEDFKSFIEEVYILCKKYTDNVFLALEREEYGVKRMEDDLCTKLDFEEMKDTDLFIAIPEDSLGVAVEIGWASSMKKKIILILDGKYNYSPLIKSIGVITKTDKLYIDTEEGYKTHKKSLLEILENMISERINDTKVS